MTVNEMTVDEMAVDEMAVDEMTCRRPIGLRDVNAFHGSTSSLEDRTLVRYKLELKRATVNVETNKIQLSRLEKSYFVYLFSCFLGYN